MFWDWVAQALHWSRKAPLQQQEQTWNQLALVSFLCNAIFGADAVMPKRVFLVCLVISCVCCSLASINRKWCPIASFMSWYRLASPCLVFYEGFIGAINSCLRLSKTNAALPRKATSQQEEPTCNQLTPLSFCATWYSQCMPWCRKGYFLFVASAPMNWKGCVKTAQRYGMPFRFIATCAKSTCGFYGCILISVCGQEVE